MLETLTQQKETFSNENIAGISVSVEDKLASLFVTGVNSYDEPSFAEYTQNEIREFISLLLDVHEYMDLNNQKQQEDNQMKLFDETEENEAEEIIIDESDETQTQSIQEFSEIIDNSTAFLYMTNDYANERISKVEINQALHILMDSI